MFWHPPGRRPHLSSAPSLRRGHAARRRLWPAAATAACAAAWQACTPMQDAERTERKAKIAAPDTRGLLLVFDDLSAPPGEASPMQALAQAFAAQEQVQVIHVGADQALACGESLVEAAEARILRGLELACQQLRQNHAKGLATRAAFAGAGRGAAFAMDAMLTLSPIRTAPSGQHKARIDIQFHQAKTDALAGCETLLYGAADDASAPFTVQALALYDRRDDGLHRKGAGRRTRFPRQVPARLPVLHVTRPGSTPLTDRISRPLSHASLALEAWLEDSSQADIYAQKALRSFISRHLASILPHFDAHDAHRSAEPRCFGSFLDWALTVSRRAFRRQRLSAYKREGDGPDSQGDDHTGAAEPTHIGYSQQRLGEVIQIGSQAISAIEYGDGMPHLVDQSVGTKEDAFSLLKQTTRWNAIYHVLQTGLTLPVPIHMAEARHPSSAPHTFRLCDIHQLRAFLAAPDGNALPWATWNNVVSKVKWYAQAFKYTTASPVFRATWNQHRFLYRVKQRETTYAPHTPVPTQPHQALRTGALQLMWGALWTFLNRPSAPPSSWTGTWLTRDQAQDRAHKVRANIRRVVVEGLAPPELYLERCFVPGRLCDIDPSVR
ncbi:MAG: hypothetical protein ACPGUV_04825, partial [Polyangiales bacterium]